MAKYLACRESPAKRKLFRQTRKAIAQASTYAQKHMIDAKGVLNPGLMPQRLEDLDLDRPGPQRGRRCAGRAVEPRRRGLAQRDRVPHGRAPLRHQQRPPRPGQHGVMAGGRLPLDRARRWHRRIRTRTEAVWDYLWGRLLHVPDAGVVLDRALNRSVPAPLVAQLDDSLDLLVENPQLDDDEADPFAAAADEADRLTATLSSSQVSLAELAAEPVDADKDEGAVAAGRSRPAPILAGQSFTSSGRRRSRRSSKTRPRARAPSRPATALSRSARTD